jgi:hypothetical protein
MRKFCALALVAVLAAAAPAVFGQGKAKVYKVTGFVGKSTSEAAPNVAVALLDRESGEVVGTDQTNFFGKYTIKNVPPGVYVLQVDKIERTLAVKDKNVRLDIDMSAEGGMMDYMKTGVNQINAEKKAAEAGGAAGAPAGGGQAGGEEGAPAAEGQAGGAPGGGPTDAGLMNYFAGEYYSYSSGSTIYGGAGTERKMTLCADGLYRDSSEFSASGTGQWGAVNAQGSGAARWAIQGDKSQGTITVTYANGRTKRFNYRVLTKDGGEINFDGVKYAYAGAAKCR